MYFESLFSFHDYYYDCYWSLKLYARQPSDGIGVADGPWEGIEEIEMCKIDAVPCLASFGLGRLDEMRSMGAREGRFCIAILDLLGEP